MLSEATLIASIESSVTSVAIGTLAEAVAVQSSEEVLHLVEINGRTPRTRWSVKSSTYGSQAKSASALAVDEASEWVVTAGSDGALQLWSMIDGLPGPLLETRYGTFTGLAFPKPNHPPVSVEERGRVTFIETEGVQRMKDLATIEPTDAETLMLMFLAPRVRLAEIQKRLALPGVTRDELEAYQSIAAGLVNLGRFYDNVSPAKAREVLEQVERHLDQAAE